MSTDEVIEMHKEVESGNQLRIQTVRDAIRDVPDFPKAGVLFRDITPALADSKVFSIVIDLLAEECKRYGPTKVLGIEARGFIIGAAVAARLETGFVPLRKPGKLPSKTYGADYELEYGKSRVEMHEDALGSSDRVVIVDDLLATGGTAFAACELVEAAQAKIEAIVCLMDLAFLPWREKLSDRNVKTFITYDSE